MALSSLTAVTPIDGRYGRQTAVLSNYFSEFALIKYRIHVEIEYLIALSETIEVSDALADQEVRRQLRDIVTNFTEADALRV